MDNIRDLGVIFDNQLKFDKHINFIRNKAVKTMGFVLRWTQTFKLFNSVLTLFKTLLGSNLE